MTNLTRFVKLSDVEPKHLIPNATARLIHTEHMTLAYWDFEADGELGFHSHPHEQVCNVIEGVFKLTVDGVPYHLEVGTACRHPAARRTFGPGDYGLFVDRRFLSRAGGLPLSAHWWMRITHRLSPEISANGYTRCR